MKNPKEWIEDIVTDHDLVQNAKTALEYDRSIGHVGSVDVSADDGVVTLTGTVYSHAQKSAVERAVRRAAGVTSVINDLNLDSPKSVFRTDQEIADAASTVLEWTVGAPDGIAISVLDGRVTLEGTVSSPDEQLAAADVVRSLVGVKAIDNRIVVERKTVQA